MPDSRFKEAFARVKELVADFEAQRHFYLSPQYQESEARKDFIDKFLIALGWDVNHDTQKNPYEQEVKVERRGEAALAQRRADYAFYLAPNYRDVRFYVEAKKPSVEIRSKDVYFQIIRYGWGASTPVGVVTDFEQFHVIDCRIKPDIDTALDNEIDVFHYRDYPDEEKFAKIYFRFSREAHATGSFDRWVAQLPPRRRGRAVRVARPFERQVDEYFLEYLDSYREKLATSFKRENPQLEGPALTEITQRTIDRLVFMRFLEDKQIHTEELVPKIAHSNSPWSAFIKTSRRLDGIYNGVVFKEHPAMDAPGFKADDQAFAAITKELSDPHSPYDFNSIPIHILGSIYERFLAKIIVTTDKRARVEEKPEVRKAGGVYYTPEYVVRYIAENTVGKLIEGKSPSQIAEMRFADISCGSGSFLLGIYDNLLRYHSKWYNENPRKALLTKKMPTVRRKGFKEKADCFERDGQLFLTLQKRREILLNNIFGIDLDPQAVEVAQLSLYLKLLQDETPASAREYQLEFHEALLPSLHNNVVCRNSLIESDILTLFGEDQITSRPIDFSSTFPAILKAQGFDAVVGNPPWGAEFSQDHLAYLRTKHERVVARMIDSYIYFIDQALLLAKPAGIIGLIVPGTILNQVDARPIRQLLLDRRLASLVNLGSGVFGPKVLNTSVIFVTGSSHQPQESFELKDLSLVKPIERESFLKQYTPANWSSWSQIVRADTHRTFFASSINDAALLHRLRASHPLLAAIVYGSIQRGVSPDIAPAHVVTKDQIEKLKLEKGLLRPSISGSQIKRYSPWHIDQWLIYTTRETNLANFPNVARHLSGFRHENTCREVQEEKHPWWSLHRPRDPAIFCSPKFIGLTTSKKIELIFDKEQNLYVTDAMYVFSTKRHIDPRLVLAVLQSKAFLFLYRVSNQGELRVIPQVKASKLDSLPFPACAQEAANTTCQLVDDLLKTKAHLGAATTETEINYLESRCADIDRRIDEIVYELYGLTSEEIAIVDGTVASQPQPESETTGPKKENEPKPSPHPTPNQEQAWADSAHFYSAKEEPPPYREDSEGKQ
jgi:adenine-specific DNA-methyltransferase